MAITDWWLGDAGVDSASVVLRSDTNGAITASKSFSGDTVADTSIEDGLVRIDFANVVADESVDITISGSTITAQLKLMPVDTPFCIGWYSCMEIGLRMIAGNQMINKHNVVASFGEGDLPYVENNIAHWGVSKVGASKSGGQTQANASAHYRAFMRNPGVKYLSQNAPFFRMGDDHEWPGDDWDHTVANANDQGLTFTLQSEVDDLFDKFNKALTGYQKGNPQNSYPTATAQKPSNADAGTDVNNYPPSYFRKRIGNAEFFMLDCISHRNPIAAVDDENKHMLGSVQEALLLSALSDSTADFKFIVSSKVFFAAASTFANQDSWAWYQTRRDVILDYIRDNNITTVAILSGDQHTPQISYALQSEGDNWDMFEVCACPVGVPLTGVIDTATENKELLVWANQVYGIVQVFDTHCLIEQYSIDGKRASSTRLNAGSNIPVLTNNQIAFG
ncbi:MAG: alkaline phosphatase D family protein [Gammaproteobacteria bacterium]|nr:alkaline phosphatase D family protein [Gammaproteobacteria bacterium]